MSSDLAPDKFEELATLWESCQLSAEQRTKWDRLDLAMDEATPPISRKPADDELAAFQEAKTACDVFVASLEPDLQSAIVPIIEFCRRERKLARQKAEKKDKKVRKAAAKGAQNSAQAGTVGGPDGDTRMGQRMESHPPTILDELSCEASDNPLHAPSVEVEHVHKLYDSIADHWSHTRYKAWPKVEAFIRQLQPGSLVADLGCGNGKNIPAVKESGGYVLASDMSAPLVKIAVDTHDGEGAVADCLFTNFRGGVFDAAISIAVLHHLSTEPRRVQALREAARLLRPGGLFLVYCWSYEQDDERSKSHHRFPGQDVLVPWSFRTPSIKKQTQAQPNADSNASLKEDTHQPGDGAAGYRNSAEPHDTKTGAQDDWQEAPPVLQRYCHVYEEGELVALLGQVSELEIVDTWFDTGNWCAVSRRR